jgi:3-hydroxy-9,10-secoandrosta-1,3,5(10)-triene-9,17-dione monooxygenase reductase component
MLLNSFDPDPDRFRQVFGHFATGVTVITGVYAGLPVGFACQAFAALSLDPPLVLFCPAKSSTSWLRIAHIGQFTVNVLSAEQQDLARKFGVSSPNKFADVAWTAASNGTPVLGDVLTWASCAVQAVHEAGDHFIVVARVLELGGSQAGEPLVFYRGRFAVSPPCDVKGPPEAIDTLLAWPQFADWM